MADFSDIALLYSDQQLTLKQIAGLKDCSSATISRRLRKQGIVIRHCQIDWNDLSKLYHDEGKSVHEIAKLKGTQNRIVRKHLRDAKILARTKSDGQLLSWQKGNRKVRHILTGELSPLWKGGRWKGTNGYILVYCPDHPYANGSYVYEHRLVMEKIIGRYLLPWEIVHHKGTKYPVGSIEDKGDNRPENLHLYSCQAEHLPSIMVTRRLHKLEVEVVELRKQNRFLQEKLLSR